MLVRLATLRLVKQVAGLQVCIFFDTKTKFTHVPSSSLATVFAGLEYLAMNCSIACPYPLLALLK
jgi:hypothetical protein